MTGQTAEITWRDDEVPVSAAFDDPYYSVTNGLAESRYVFLQGNGLPARFTPGFHIAELGFGTGLNMLAAWQAWRGAGVDGSLNFTSFEAFPMHPDDMARALHVFPEVAHLAAEFLSVWGVGQTKLDLPGLSLRLIPGDARDTVPEWTGRADAWFLDGFAPARNPELWQADLMADVAVRTTGCGTFATYTAAGDVRRALGDAGFSVQRVPGYGNKRHMTTGQIERPS